ncbi:response regulator transcription factor [Aquabacterium sp. NJ1]|uniref:helix-turn-helix transcriptional regulator n=1 Tax=Aquabacterium sp. NJ1 TaxID=1538295 RepID=UPI0009DD6BEA|nr:response regulator transcription factor [Aquabacterium sp. NJ1]
MSGTVIAAPGSGQRMRIALVENNLALREQLGRAIAENGRFELWFETSSAVSAMEWTQTCSVDNWPEIWLVGLHLQDGRGLSVIRHAIGYRADTLALVISASLDEQAIVDAVQAGATGFIQTGMGDKQFAKDLEHAVDGNVPLSPKIATRFLSSFRRAITTGGHAAALDAAMPLRKASSTQGDNAPPQLTAREKAILDWLSRGCTYGGAAQRLHISVNTVRHCIRGIYTKLGVHSKTDAIEEACKRRWLQAS